MSDEWNNVKDVLPGHGVPVLLKINGVVQDVTYCLDAGDNDPTTWFEPYYFEYDELKVGVGFDCSPRLEWIYVDSIV